MPAKPASCVTVGWPKDCLEAEWVSAYDFPQAVNRACAKPCRGSKHWQQLLWLDPLALKPVAKNCCEDTSPLDHLLIIIARPTWEALQGDILGCPEGNELIGRERGLADCLGLSELQG
jgi:hypothetical protein